MTRPNSEGMPPYLDFDFAADALESRAVMTDPDFVKTLTDNDFIVWAGDIRYRDAYQSMAP